VIRVFGPRLDRQVPAQQRIEQPVLGDLQFAPAVQMGGVGEVRTVPLCRQALQ
jgi:hypothetical protein